MSSLEFAFLQSFIRRKTGIVLSDAKAYLAESRLPPVIARHGTGDLAGLVRALKRSDRGALAQDVIDAFTTNETSFFRDRHPFELLEKQLLPGLILARRKSRTLRLWSAACSTGQEAYSLGILLLDRFPELARWDVSILGTDICTEVLDRARAGRYRSHEITRGLSEALRDRFFEPDGRAWRVGPELRRMTRFEQLNLVSDQPPRQVFDVVFLRNVLIYFDAQTQQQLLRRVHRTIAPDGFLVLGAAEGSGVERSLYDPHIEGRTVWHTPRKAA